MEIKLDNGPEKIKVDIGTMVQVVNMDHDIEVKEGPGNRKWLLGEVVELCEENGKDWMRVHFWRSYGQMGNPRRIYFPVWASPDGKEEVYMKNPRAAGGIRDAKKWLHWYEPWDLATLSVVVCEEKGKGGLELKAWREDFEFATDA